MTIDKKKAAVARNTAASTDLRHEIEEMTRLVVYARECMKNELMGGAFAHTQEMLKKNVAKDLQALATSVEKLVGIKIKYDSHLKNEADKLTPEEEQDALVEFFASLTVSDRRAFIRRLVDRHNNMVVGTSYHPIKINVGERD